MLGETDHAPTAEVPTSANHDGPIRSSSVTEIAAPSETLTDLGDLQLLQRLQGTAGNAAVVRMLQAKSGSGDRTEINLRRMVQPKLQVSSPSDPPEVQAEAMAARITGGTPHRSHQPSPVQPASLAGAGTSNDEAVSQPLEAYVTGVSGGTAIPDDARDQIEPELGVDLTDVRVHTDSEAAAAAATINARAFTYGNDIFLGAGESISDLALMAHESTHVMQQGSLPAPQALRQAQGTGGAQGTLYRDFSITDVPGSGVVLDAVHALPGYQLLSQIIGEDPLTGAAVTAGRTEFVQSLLAYGPFAGAVGPVLQTLEALDGIFDLIQGRLAENNLTFARIKADIDAAWEEVDLLEGVDFNVAIVRRYVNAIINDVTAFAAAIVADVIALVREAAVSFVEPLVQTDAIKPIWDLGTKVFHYDPLRDEAVDAPTVDILADFLRLIGKEDALAQMAERGTLQQTADWLDTQFATFAGLLTQASQLFTDAWDAISPENLPSIVDNLESLGNRAYALLNEVAEFAQTVIAQVLELVKNALLGWLSDHAHEVPGFHLLTVILGRNPFTGQTVERTAENLIKGFITLLPNGEQIFDELAESGVIADAAGRIETAMTELNISWELITGTFLAIWDGLSLEDLLDPIGAFQRVVDQFGEPLARIIEFIATVIGVVLELILKLMNFPSELLGNIIANAMAAIEDIKRDPIAFLQNIIEALKQGVMGFLDNIAQYLLQGLTDWLFRGLRDLGIEPPTSLSLEAIITLVLQVLGLTVETLWTTLGEKIGPDNVALIRGAIDKAGQAWAFIKDVQERGITAIWEFISSQLSNLWDVILQKAKDWIISEIIEKVTVKLISMLDPTGIMAVINSAIAFFNAVQSAIEYLRDILEIVDRYVSTMAAVARGDVTPGAVMMEQGLASAVPVAIGFLANQVGLANVPEKIAEIIQGLRELIDQALDWLFDQAWRLGQAALGALGLGPDTAAAEPPTPEPEGATPAADQIPEGLPPEEIKARVLAMTQESLTGGSVTSIAGMHARLAAIETANRSRGLLSLRAHVDPGTMVLTITAAASPPDTTTLAWGDIFSPSEIELNADLEVVRQRLQVAGMATNAALAVDGAQIGAISASGGGVHAEERILTGALWQSAITIAGEHVRSNGSAVVTLLINRSPCVSCVEHLKSAIGVARAMLGADASTVTFRLAALGTYKVRKVLKKEDLEALTAGVKELISNPDRKKSFGKPFDQVYRRELEIWKDDLGSMSTEYVDPETGEIASGLGDVTAAGWQVFGLDSGRPATPRQLELRAKATELLTQADK